MSKKEKEKDHPFPNKELELLMKLNAKETLTKEEFEIISNLLHKYLDLRADVFHEFEIISNLDVFHEF